MATTVHDFSVKTIDGGEQSLRDYKGKALLIVNVASRCGLTPQYEKLEALYRKYKAKGLEILAFPANDFAQQEPGTDEEIKGFCQSKYDVTFPLFSKISVKGSTKHPLYAFLTDPATNPASPGEVAWNFGKFLISKDGAIVGRFNPQVEPDAPEVTSAIEKAL